MAYGAITAAGTRARAPRVKRHFGPDPYLGAHYDGFVSTLIVGHPDKADKRMSRHMAQVREHGRSIDLCNYLTLACTERFLLGDIDHSIRDSTSSQRGFQMYQLMGEAVAHPSSYDWSQLTTLACDHDRSRWSW